MVELSHEKKNRKKVELGDTSAQLVRVKEKIMRAWESRVRAEILGLPRSTGPVLRNMLPELLQNLVSNLSPESKNSDFTEAGRIGTEHGAQRADVLEYSVSQVLHEYRILRQVIFHVLEEEKLHATEVRDVILNVLDEGIQKAIVQFSMMRSRRLEQSNLDLEHFAAIAAHDLKSPLATIAGYMELLEDDVAGKVEFDDLEYIRTVRRLAAQSTILIDRLLEYSSIGRNVEAFAQVRMDAVVNRAVENLGELAQVTNTKVIFRDLPQVTGEYSLLAQLMQNLFSNAIKFRSPERAPEIQIEAKEENNQWLFSVKDNGIGFRPEESEDIFALFKKFNSQKSHKGYGIGLATAKKVVTLHGGRIWAESQPGIGSTFFFTLAKIPPSLHGF